MVTDIAQKNYARWKSVQDEILKTIGGRAEEEEERPRRRRSSSTRK
jgi:hypothetical protein